VNVEVAALELRGHGFQRPEIHHIDRARADELRNPLAACGFEPVRSCAEDAADHEICKLGGGDVEDSSNGAVIDQLFHRLSPAPVA